MATAIGKSYTGPSFFTSAGAIFTVILETGNSKRQFLRLALTRSLLSLTAASGSPTISNLGRPLLKSASTTTEKLSIPNIPRLFAFANIIFLPEMLYFP